ncbi:MAG: hypothetical protein DRP70_16595 [Spirochaetes bacterium]|nr:MAG: hypothetical protein DRP70_16595 [Spirochaetota bacterium]
MQPKDFSKRKFKMIPGADYSDGPISKYGTFGNMLRQRAITGLKKSADNIPMSAADISGENIEQITDFVNPMAGMFKTMDKVISKDGIRIVNDALRGFKSSGNTIGLRSMPKWTRQELADNLFNSRSMDRGKVKGLTTGQSDYAQSYDGLTTQMKPSDFLNLAKQRNEGTHNIDKAKDFSKNIVQEAIEGKKPRLGPPKLWMHKTPQEDALIVNGHEGRHRSDAIWYMLDDVVMPVDINFRGLNRGDLDQTILDLPLTSEDGKILDTTLRKLLPEGFDTSALQAAE